MQVQKTIGVVEALDERISLAEEDIAAVEAELGRATARNTTSGVAHGAVLIGLVAGVCVVTLIVAAAASPEVGVMVAIVGFLALGKLKKKAPPVDTGPLHARLEALRAERDRLLAEKRDLVLGFERQIKADSAPVQANIEDELAAEAADTKTCPMCAETVKAKARICKHCRHEFGR